MIQVSEKTTFLKLPPLYIALSLIFLILSVLQKTLNFSNYTATVLYFSIPTVIVGVLFQMYPTVQGTSVRFEKLTYLHLILILISFPLYLFNLNYTHLYFLSSLVFLLYLIFNTKKYAGITQLYFVVGTLFYVIASTLILLKHKNTLFIKHTIAVGFLLTVVYGSLYIFLPMLQLEQLAYSGLQKFHLIFHTLSTIVLLIGWHGLNFFVVYIGGLLNMVSFFILVFILYKTLSQKKSPLRGLDPSVKAFILSVFLLGFSLTIGTLSAGKENFSLIKLHFEGLLYGFFPIVTLGAAYHIIPFMLWWKKYAPKMGREKVPTLKELLPEETINKSLFLLVPSLTGMIVFDPIPWLSSTFALIYAYSIFYFLYRSLPLILEHIK